jgi:hypothetical protein
MAAGSRDASIRSISCSTHLPFGLAAIAAAFALRSVVSETHLPRHRPPLACGFPLPGASPLWEAQSGSLHIVDGEPPLPPYVAPEIRWPTEAGRVLYPRFLEDALSQLDAGATSVPSLDTADVAEQRLLRSHMIPHVIRAEEASIARTNTLRAPAALEALADLRGVVKVVDDSTFIPKYYGGAETFATLREYVTAAQPGYWLACVPASASHRTNAKEAEQAGFSAAAGQWVNEAVSAFGPAALLGFNRSIVTQVCLRATLGRSRLSIHSDAGHGFLVHLGAGSRRVLLFMPDTAKRLKPQPLDVGVPTAHRSWGGGSAALEPRRRPLCRPAPLIPAISAISMSKPPTGCGAHRRWWRRCSRATRCTSR